MSEALTVPAPQWDTPEMVKTLKETVAKGATDSQFRMFLEVCRSTGLNPFLKEIYFVPQVGVMAARDGYLRVANEHPQFDGMETHVERDEKKIPIKAVCTVYRKDRAHPVVCEAYYNEYKKSSQVWQTYPSAMISKVAEVLALKRSFSINGVVTEEEIGEQGSKEAQQEVLQRKLAEGKAKQIAAPKEGVTLADVVENKAGFTDADIIEQRHASEVAEVEAVIEETERANPKPKRNKGDIGFKALGDIGDQKKTLRSLTGDDTAYYGILKEAGVSHADELAHVTAKPVWLALARLAKKLETDKTTREEFQAEASRLAKKFGFEGPKRFTEHLSALGFDSLDAVIEEATGEQVSALLSALRAL